MKTKISFLVFILYIMTLITSYGLFNCERSMVEINTIDMVDACSLDRVYPTKASVASATKTYNTYLEAYFSNLTENFGENYKGSCGYVAMGMILSYFDNYYSDEIVPEEYDVRSSGIGRNMIIRNSSPGVMKDDYLFAEYGKLSKDVTAQEYYNYLLSYERYSLHAKLILYANNIQGLYDFNDQNNPCGITMSEMDNVIKCYLMYERGFKIFSDFNVYSIESDDEEKVKQFIIENLDKGLPVYTCLKDDTGGHATVAYAHDSNGNIYLHSGWHGYGTRQTVSSLGYKKIYRALALNFFLPEHIHSDNYAVVKSGETQNYCYCSDEIVTYKHTEHNYVYDHAKINSDTHYAYCACGEKISEKHAYSSRYERNYALMHTAYCKCGDNKTEKHLWTSYSQPNLIGQYVQCKFCKYLKKLKDDVFVPIEKWRIYNILRIQ